MSIARIAAAYFYRFTQPKSRSNHLHPTEWEMSRATANLANSACLLCDHSVEDALLIDMYDPSVLCRTAASRLLTGALP